MKKSALLSPKLLKTGDTLCVGTSAENAMKEKHIRHSTWLCESTAEKVRSIFRSDNCQTQSEFIEKAILYYIGYLKAESNTDYLSPTIMSSVKAASNENTSRMSRMLFKLAVEVALMNNLIAAMIHFEPEKYSALKRECEREVRRTNGEFGMDEALRWQRKVEDNG